VIRSSTPGSFCIGADLKERRGVSDGGVVRSLNDLVDMCDRITKLPIPALVAVNEPVVGGGLEPALVRDIRVAVQAVYRIALPECRIGIIPSTGRTQRLPGFVRSSRVTGEGAHTYQ